MVSRHDSATFSSKQTSPLVRGCARGIVSARKRMSVPSEHGRGERGTSVCGLVLLGADFLLNVPSRQIRDPLFRCCTHFGRSTSCFVCRHWPDSESDFLAQVAINHAWMQQTGDPGARWNCLIRQLFDSLQDAGPETRQDTQREGFASMSTSRMAAVGEGADLHVEHGFPCTRRRVCTQRQ